MHFPLKPENRGDCGEELEAFAHVVISGDCVYPEFRIIRRKHPASRIVFDIYIGSFIKVAEYLVLSKFPLPSL